MKISFRALFTLTLLYALPGMAQQKSPAVVYLETIGAEFNGVSSDMMSYTSAATHGKGARKVEKRRQELIARIELAERNVRKMKPFEGDASLRDSVVHYFDLTHKVITEDFDKILNMEEIAEQSYDAMEAYMLAKEKASDKLHLAYESVDRQQDAFIAKNKVKVIAGSSKLSEKLKEAGNVSNYYNKLYLLFFKSYKDEAYLLDALGKPDVNAKEQTKNALLKSASDGLSQVGPIAAYRGDASVKLACQQLLSFYQNEAQSATATLIDFDLKKENFEKVKKAFEAKRAAEQTQADIDLYNKAVKEFNEAVNKVNAVSNDLNKKRAQLLENWNKVSDQFLSKHTPRYNG